MRLGACALDDQQRQETRLGRMRARGVRCEVLIVDQRFKVIAEHGLANPASASIQLGWTAAFTKQDDCTNKKACYQLSSRLCMCRKALSGVADGARTHDNRNHNPGLYQLSYSHRKKQIITANLGVNY